MATTRMNASNARRPRKRSRASAYAQKAPRPTHSSVVAPATTSEFRIGVQKRRSPKSDA
jgi:hypothetical protein